MTNQDNLHYEGTDFYCDQVFSGKISVRIEFESESVLAFHHTKPSYKTHIVVVPKKHIPAFTDADDETILELMRVVRNIASKIMKTSTGCRVITNLGKFQDSKHLHWHVIDGEKNA